MNNINPKNFGVPVFFNILNNNNNNGIGNSMKLSEDRYDVYVDDKYVGEKILYAQKEDFHAVSDFLERQGFNNVEIELNGDHIIVHADNQNDASQMRQALEVYLNNR